MPAPLSCCRPSEPFDRSKVSGADRRGIALRVVFGLSALRAFRAIQQIKQQLYTFQVALRCGFHALGDQHLDEGHTLSAGRTVDRHTLVHAALHDGIDISRLARPSTWVTRLTGLKPAMQR